MVDVAQLVSAPDCGSGGRGFESLHPPHSFVRCSPGPPHAKILGCRQAVRQRTLTPSCVGSNPAIPARDPLRRILRRTGPCRRSISCPCHPAEAFFVISHDPLAQSAEHLPFKQGVRSSNLRRVTIKSKRYRCHWRKASGINRFRAFFAQKFTNESIDANRCFPLTGGIRTPFSQWLAKQKACSALFEASIFKKGAIFLPIEYTKFAASICWS